MGEFDSDRRLAASFGWWSDRPRCVRVADRVLIVSVPTIVALGAAALATVLFWPEAAKATNAPMVFQLALVAIPVVFISYAVRVGAVCRRAKRARYLACMNCMYDLQSLDAPGVAGGACPECGRIFRFHELAQSWKQIHKSIAIPFR